MSQSLESVAAKKYELLVGDWLRAGDRTVYRIRALRDFGDVRRGDLGGYVESEANLSHSGDCWVHNVAQVYGAGAVVRGNARARGEAWVLGRLEDDAEVCDLAIVEAGSRIGGRTVLLSDEIARYGTQQEVTPMRPEVCKREGSGCHI